MMDKQDILLHLQSEFRQDIILLSETDSTNLYAKRLYENGKKGCFAVHAESQTTGRGRQGREFVSPMGSGIYLTLAYDIPLAAENAGLITVYTAVAVREAILTVCGKACGIKWVNDLYLDGKKVCGILTEGRVNYDTKCFSYFLVGIGINVTPPKGGFCGAAKDVAGAIFDENVDIHGIRAHLIAEIIHRMAPLADKLAKKEYLADYRKYNLIPGRQVTVYQTLIGKGESYLAKALYIDEEGHLVVQDENGEIRTLYAGEVSCKWIEERK